MNISGIDLNLLPVLAAVLEESNVTKAAKRLNLTQSAVSNSLARARLILGDPLLVRDGRRLVPTPMSRELLPMLQRMLLQVENVFQAAAPQNPLEIEREFTLACADNQCISDVDHVARLLMQQMPRCSLRVVTIDFVWACLEKVDTKSGGFDV